MLLINGLFLSKLIREMDFSVQNLYSKNFTQINFILAFNAFLRLGEMLIKSKLDTCNAIQRRNILFEFQRNVTVIVLMNLKTNKLHCFLCILLYAKTYYGLRQQTLPI